MSRYFFTFGGGHPFAFEYIEIQAEDIGEARDLMFSIFDRKWSMCYDESGFAGQPEAYGLHCLAVLRKNAFGNWRSSEPNK